MLRLRLGLVGMLILGVVGDGQYGWWVESGRRHGR